MPNSPSSPAINSALPIQFLYDWSELTFVQFSSAKTGEKKPIRLPVGDAKDMHEDEKITILDVVDPETYKERPHKIKSAVRIDPRHIKDEFEQLPKDRPVLTYCT